MIAPQDDYHAYLIRLRRTGTPPIWRVSLHDVHSDLQLQFKQVAELIEFLHTKFERSEGEQDLRVENFDEGG